MNLHTQFHTQFGFCPWDAAALIALVAMIVVLVVHSIRQKKRERDFESELGEKIAQETRQENQ